MRVIKIEFTRPAKWHFAIFSQLIRAFQKTPYSHVRLRWTNTTGRDVIYEASGSQIHFIGELAQPQKPVDIINCFEIQISVEEYKGLVDLCMRYAALKYGLLQIFGTVLVIILSLKKNPYADGKKSQVCSEVVGRFLEEVLNFNLNLDLDTAGPKELFLALMEKTLEFPNMVKKVQPPAPYPLR